MNAKAFDDPADLATPSAPCREIMRRIRLIDQARRIYARNGGKMAAEMISSIIKKVEGGEGGGGIATIQSIDEIKREMAEAANILQSSDKLRGLMRSLLNQTSEAAKECAEVIASAKREGVK